MVTKGSKPPVPSRHKVNEMLGAGQLAGAGQLVGAGQLATQLELELGPCSWSTGGTAPPG